MQASLSDEDAAHGGQHHIDQNRDDSQLAHTFCHLLFGSPELLFLEDKDVPAESLLRAAWLFVPGNKATVLELSNGLRT